MLALLLPAKLWRSLAGGGVRQYLADHTHVRVVRDYSDAAAVFDAAVYPSLLVATRLPAMKKLRQPTLAQSPVPDESDVRDVFTHHIHVSITRGEHEHAFDIPARALSMAGDDSAPWLLLPQDARNAFERMRRAGPALGDSSLGRPLLGVKCGLNAAFLVHATEHDDDMATISGDGREYLIERTLLRPALRGESISARVGGTRCSASNDLRILWTHGADGAALRSLPPRTSRWFARYRSQLESRKDARSKQPWWTLFRTEAARSESARLVWADLGRSLRTAILPPGDPTVPLNSCYVMRLNSLVDAHALDVLLTSPIAAAWLDAIAEPARGGWRRFLGWTVGALPLPDNWERARIPLEQFWRAQQSNASPSADEHVAVVADAFGIPLQTLIPLLSWRAR